MTQKNVPAYEMEKWTGEFGGSIDAWWAPEKGSVLKGVLVGLLPQTRSEKLQSDQLLFELVEDCKGCTHGGSDKIKGKKGDEGVTAPAGAVVGVPVYKTLEGMHPGGLGFVFFITLTGLTPIAGKSPMKNFDVQKSTRPVRNIAPPSNGSAPQADTGPYQT